MPKLENYTKGELKKIVEYFNLKLDADLFNKKKNIIMKEMRSVGKKGFEDDIPKRSELSAKEVVSQKPAKPAKKMLNLKQAPPEKKKVVRKKKAIKQVKGQSKLPYRN